ncbi:Actin- protein 6, partial [Hypocenomyce scalaris]|nr:Actin- protein 6 [Hypocenomyce scalaris]
GVGDRRKVGDDGGNIVVDYVLPDYNTHKQGYIRPYDPSLVAKLKKTGPAVSGGGVVEDFMTLGNERFTVPELLFNPGDVGMKQAGLPETVMQSLSGLPHGLWPAMLANVVVVGGNAKIDGFVERFTTELRQLAPAECIVRVARSPDPIQATWLGGCRLVSNKSLLKELLVTRQEYQEHGNGWLLRRFANGKP